jgi:hypothetical protein
MRVVFGPLAAGAILLVSHSVAYAQPPEPIGPLAADVRVTWARFKEDPSIASALGVSAANLPTRGLGFVLGGHWYPIRRSGVTLGIGGEFIRARAQRTREPATQGGEEGPTVETRFSSLSPQVSLNFGRKNGWSYISGGIGSSAFTVERVDQPLGEGSRARTTNYGGGARWFTKKHLAVSVDLRFYSISPQPQAAGRPPFPKVKMMVISGGIAVR